LGSHLKAVKAHEEGRLKDELVPFEMAQRKGSPLVYDKDEGQEPTHLLRSSERCSPLSKSGTVTAGNSSPLSDGAAALLLTTPQKAEQLKLKPMVRIVASAAAGVHPNYMGMDRFRHAESAEKSPV